MLEKEAIAIKDAVHKLQLSLLEGIKYENQLFAAGSVLSRSDYRDVVIERTIAKMCGYPLCGNSLPSERPWKGRYRISLKEHKVYDLQETYMYCSSNCLIHSQAFATSLQEERSSILNPTKLNDVLKLFDGLSVDATVNMGKNGDLGLSKLQIQEKDADSGEVSYDEWIGPSNAIDGYVPRRDQNMESKQSTNLKKDVKQKGVAESGRSNDQLNIADILGNDMNFTSTIITQDEYNISKIVTPAKDKEPKGKVISENVNNHKKTMQKSVAPLSAKDPKTKGKNLTAKNVKLSVFEDAAGPSQIDATKEENKLELQKQPAAGASALKSSLKTSVSKKEKRSVTWADDLTDGAGQNSRECRKIEDKKGAPTTSHSVDKNACEESYRVESAEACVRALSQAAAAVASGKSDTSDAVSEAGVVILPPPHKMDEKAWTSNENGDVLETDAINLKWPPKSGFLNGDLFDSDDSWYDSPPEGFNLTLSPFSTMFMAIFAWISSSSLAYIYGKEESSYEDYLSVNGREYPPKIIISNGQSSEIKQTLAGCLARALPGLIAELRLPIPTSTLEQGMGRLLDTMSFTDPLPAFRMKQWQVIALLFLGALSVSRIPALTPYLMGTRILLPKVLEGAHITTEEFEIMKDIIIPLGRVPQFSTHSGG